MEASMCSDKVETPNKFFEPARPISQLFKSLSQLQPDLLNTIIFALS